MLDAIILGAGAAGLSAGLWCDELGLETLVLESAPEIGGQLLWVYNPIENHLGAPSAQNGRELRDRFAEQTKQRNFKLRLGVEIEKVDLTKKEISCKNGEVLTTRGLILATGVRRRKLNVAGENEFVGRGILESGKRDAAKVAGKNVCIVGGGDAAAENALILAETAAKVYLLHRGAQFRARREFLDEIIQHPKIEIFTETVVKAIAGNDRVEKVEAQNQAGETFSLAVAAILIRIGVEPNTDLFRGQIELDDNGYIAVNARCETIAENVFAVGDVANPLAPTVSSAIGAGATAAKVLLAKLSR